MSYFVMYLYRGCGQAEACSLIPQSLSPLVQLKSTEVLNPRRVYNACVHESLKKRTRYSLITCNGKYTEDL